MRKLLYSLCFSAIGTFRCLAQEDVVALRNTFYKVAEKNVSAATLLDKAAKMPTALAQGYKGIAYLMMARQAWNPVSKWSYFNKGKHTLEKAIKADPNNTELRYLRFSVQTNLPSFLRYSGNIEEDEQFIRTHLQQLQDDDLKMRVQAYLNRYQKRVAMIVENHKMQYVWSM